MKKIKIKLSLILVITLVLEIIYTPLYQCEGAEISSNFEKISENNNLRLYVDKSSGEFKVVDKQDNYTWWSNPPNRKKDKKAKGLFKMQMSSQLLVNFVDFDQRVEKLVNNYTSCVKKNKLEVKQIDNGFRVEYFFKQQGVSIPVEVTLGENYLDITIPINEIKEDSDKVTKVLAISPYPYFGAGNIGEDGYLFIPDGSGAVVSFDKGKYRYKDYKNYIYGKDESITELVAGAKKQNIKLPVFGVKKDNHSMLGIIEDGDSHGMIETLLGGIKSSYSTVFSTFNLRARDNFNVGLQRETYFQHEKINLPNIKIKYYFLSNEDANYSGMARCYRQYLVDNNNAEYKQLSDNYPFHITLTSGVNVKKSVLGVPRNVIEPLTSFNQATEIVNEIKKQGINDIYITNYGITKDGYKGKIPKTFNIAKEFGNKKNFNEMINTFKALNIKYAPSENFINFRKGRTFFPSIFEAVKNMGKLPVKLYNYDYGLGSQLEMLGYLLMPQKVMNNIEGYINGINKYGLRSLSLHNLGRTLYSNYTGNYLERWQTKKIFIEDLKQIKDKVKYLEINKANAYAIPYADMITNAPVYSSNYDIFDYSVPFYQIVLSGLVNYTTPEINLSYDSKEMFLKAIETGSILNYTLIYESPSVLKRTNLQYLFGSDYRNWLTKVGKDYKQLNEIYQNTNNSPIYHHCKIDDGVYKTTYENGCSVVVNYNQNDFNYKGKIVKPRNYLFVEGRE